MHHHPLLNIVDLTTCPDHAIGLCVDLLRKALESVYPNVALIRGDKVVHADHNYRLLGYNETDVTLNKTYTHWVDEQHLLRTQTTSVVVGELIKRSAAPQCLTLLAPGIVYRRDVRDRWHCGQPHQMDIWIVYPKRSPYHHENALSDLITLVTNTLIPDVDLNISDTSHQYTQYGKEVEAWWDNRWLEIMECGHIDDKVLQKTGWDDTWTGLALGMGLDRMVMVRKNCPDIRLLRDQNPLAQKQMRHLGAWKDVSRQPPAKRDLSLTVDTIPSLECLTERVEKILGTQSTCLECVEIKGVYCYDQTPLQGRERLGMAEHQSNILITITLRHPTQSLPREDVNGLLKRVYQHLHEGQGWAYCP